MFDIPLLVLGCVKLPLVSHLTHQQCKDSVSVLNPLESPAAFLCLKHNVRLRPMHGAGKANCDSQMLNYFRSMPPTDAAVQRLLHRAAFFSEMFLFQSCEIRPKKQVGNNMEKEKK